MKMVARVLRTLLVVAALGVVVWSFLHVGLRSVRAWQAARSDTRTELTILHWGDNDEIAIVESLVAAFEAQNPDIRITRLHASDYDTKLNTMFAAGTAPDLFYLGYENLPKLASMGLLAPLDERIAADTESAGRDWTADFFPVLLEAYRYDGNAIGKGPLYGVPKDFTTWLFYVNLDLFDRAGVPVPYDGWTWEQYESAMKKISALKDPGGEVYGSVLSTWPGALQNLLWNHGGDYFHGTNFTDLALDEPPAQAALQRIHKLRFKDRTVYNATSGDAQGLGQQEFFNGRIGCVGPLGRWMTPRFWSIKSFRWDVVPIPHTPGVAPASGIATTAWSMSSSTKHPDEAYRLLRFLCGPQGQELTAQSGLAIPCTRAVAESDAFLHPDQGPAHAKLFVDLIDVARLGQLPKEAEFQRILNAEVEGAIRLDNQSTADAAENVQKRWIAELDSPLKRGTFPPVRWSLIGGLTGGAILIVVAVLLGYLRRQKLGMVDRSQERAGWLFISPWVLGFLLLTLGPMGVSLLLSLSRWTSMSPLSQAQYVGLANYRHLFMHDQAFTKSVWVTTYYALLAVPFGQVLALLVAVLMNQKVRGIVFFRTIYFVPSVVSGVALATLWVMMFDNQKGIINRILNPVLGLFGGRAPDWFGTDAEVFAIPAYVIMALWGVGAGMVIYLAGLKGIPGSLYEAARIDGASRVRQFFAITVPMLSPLIFFNLIMGIIGSFQVFTQVYVMTAGGPGDATLVYVLKLYREAFEYHKMGYASAMAWVLFVGLLALTLVVVRTSKSWVHYEGLK